MMLSASTIRFLSEYYVVSEDYVIFSYVHVNYGSRTHLIFNLS